jgi:rhodanese-related sulfurtransferase
VHQEPPTDGDGDTLEVTSRIDRGEGFVLMDVREPHEYSDEIVAHC